MIVRIVKKDLSRNRVINATLLLFIVLSAMLTATAFALVVELTGSMDALFRESSAPHFVQMHAGEIAQEDIDAFVSEQPMVVAQQTVEMRNISGASIYLGGNRSEAASVMENAFVTQNQGFDFLLDLDNRIIRLEKGQIAVPVYHMRQSGLELGDTVRVAEGGFEREYRIAAFARDAQMNPALVTSKRFVVHPEDWEELRSLGQTEYLIEFLLDDPANADAFERIYQESGLPQKDTAITWSLYRLLSALTDGLVIGVILLIALLLMAIAFLCLRFTILANQEGDSREIGVMKAIGLPMPTITRLYMGKYRALAGLGCILGYGMSLPLGKALSANITLYMGTAPITALRILLPVAGAVAVFVVVCGFCRWMLRGMRRITAVEALRAASSGAGRGAGKSLSLHKSRFPSINVFLGVRDVCKHPGRYGVLCLVFVLCSFLMILPLNLYTTVSAPDFTNYMGAARSDIRMDLVRTGEVGNEFVRLMETLDRDERLERHAAFVTAGYQVENSEGSLENIKVEIGDSSVFPLEYLEGGAPVGEGEIALSVMQAQDLGKGVGDDVTLVVEGAARQLAVCGIYQDITNGGKTAKALLPWRDAEVLWYVVNLDLKQGADLSAIINAYTQEFPTVRVMDMAEYLGQTLGGTIGQLRLAAVLALATALLVGGCITALFFRMLMAKDAREIVIMTSVGFSRRDIAVQYSVRSLLVLAVGVLLGTLAVGTLGQALVSGVTSMIGASRIRFVVEPLLAWGAYPLALLCTVTATTVLCGRHTGTAADLRSAME